MDSGLGYVVVMSLYLMEMSFGSDVCSLFGHTGYIVCFCLWPDLIPNLL